MAFYPDLIFLIILNRLDVFQLILSKKRSRFALIDFIGFFKALAENLE